MVLAATVMLASQPTQDAANIYSVKPCVICQVYLGKLSFSMAAINIFNALPIV